MVKCCAYQLSRSAGRIFFGYQNSTNPGSDQLADPTKILPRRFDSEVIVITSQRSRAVSERKFDSRKIDCLKCNGAKRSRRHKQSVASSSFLSPCVQTAFVCPGNVALCCGFIPCLSRCHAQPSRAVA